MHAKGTLWCTHVYNPFRHCIARAIFWDNSEEFFITIGGIVSTRISPMRGSNGIHYFTLTNMVNYVLQIQLDWLRDCKLFDRNFCGWSYIGAVLAKVTSTQEKRRLIFLFLFRVETASLSTAANGARPFSNACLFADYPNGSVYEG